MEILELLQQYALVPVVATCLAIGYIIKHFLPMDNKFIPLIMGVLGLLLTLWVNDFAFTLDILLAGLSSGLTATGLHQGVIQLLPNKEK